MMAATAHLTAPTTGGRTALAAGTAAALSVLIWLATGTIEMEARATLVVFALAIVGWTMTPLEDTAVALAAVLTLIGAGAIDQAALHAAFGHELIWLLLSAFLVGAVLRQTTLAERLVLAGVRGTRSIARLFHGLTLGIVATAFVIPSTSARAAILLPLFLALSHSLRDPRLTRALSLLFPSVILLSACGTVTGAGAHLIALDLLQSVPGSEGIGYLRWLVLALPIALASSHGAAFLILRLFLTADERGRAPSLPPPREAPLTAEEKYILAVVAGTIALWTSSGVHGASLAVVGVAAALLLTLPAWSGVTLKTAIRSVEWDLLLFLAATMLLGEALLSSGAGTWLAGALFEALPQSVFGRPAVIALLVAVIALLSHLLIVSRSARAAILVPALALPIASFGYSPATIVLLTVIGTGFCQTLRVSAKSVAIYGGAESAVFSANDLLKLSAALFPLLLTLLVLFALVVWPALGLSFTREGIAFEV